MPTVVPMVAPGTAAVVPVPTFNFDAAFEAKVTALAIFDDRFGKESVDYLKPEYFTSSIDANLTRIVQAFVRKYRSLPSAPTYISLIRDEKGIPPADKQAHYDRLLQLTYIKQPDRDFVRDKAAKFCQHQAYLRLALEIPDMLAKGRVDKIDEAMKRASVIGQEGASSRYDYFEKANDRKDLREQLAKGIITLGVTTGFPDIDKHLYRQGYERGGLTVIMAPSKRGKTALMGQSALQAAIAGKTVLYISLEVSNEVFTDRLDAALTNTAMHALIGNRDKIATEVTNTSAIPNRGKLYVETFPSNTIGTRKIESIVEEYIYAGIKLDLVFVDYIGILRMDDPNNRFLSLGNASKNLRAIAGKFNVALVTGAQTNRDAVGKALASMESIGESFAIVQDADLLLSINATDQEMNAGIRRIHWAAARNESPKTIEVKGNMETMRIIEKVLGVIV